MAGLQSCLWVLGLGLGLGLHLSSEGAAGCMDVHGPLGEHKVLR